jgi:hypothetical protein
MIVVSNQWTADEYEFYDLWRQVPAGCGIRTKLEAFIACVSLTSHGVQAKEAFS